jgi:phage terminase large subunit GpA-like protein
MKSAQVGATEAGNNWLGYIIHIAPGATLMVVPTDEMMRNNSNVRIDPMIAASPALRSRIGKGKKDGNTTSRKKFPGGFHIYCGAGSPVGLSSLPIENLFFDETDRYPINVGKEGSAISLGKARTTTYEDTRKIFYVSTPTIDGVSSIQKEFNNSDQCYCHVPCPHCGLMQRLMFKQLKWKDNDPATTYYECEGCDVPLKENDKRWMLEVEEVNGRSVMKRAKWIAANPGFKNKRRRGFHINALYSLLGYKWTNCVQDWMDAQGDDLKMCTWTNTVEGECWKEVVDVPDWNMLYNRRESYKLNTPNKDVAVITAGVDIQKNRIEVEIVGWCKNKESYSIDYRVYYGDTADGEVWKNLDKIVNEVWIREDGIVMPMRIMCVDSGAYTNLVYEWCRKYDTSKVIPIKGRQKLDTVLGPPKAIDLAHDGKPIGTFKCWGVGTDICKGELYGWLRAVKKGEEPTPTGYCHFPQYGEAYFKMLTAEQKVIKVNNKGYRVYEWSLPSHARNEALDCRVYARAAMFSLGCDRWKDHDWEVMRLSYLPKTPPPSETSSKSGSAFLDGKSIW